MRSERTLKGFGVFASPKRDRGPFPAQFQTLKEISDALAQPVMPDPGSFDFVNQLSAQRGRFLAHPSRDQRRRIVLQFEIGHQHALKLCGRRNHPVK